MKRVLLFSLIWIYAILSACQPKSTEKKFSYPLAKNEITFSKGSQSNFMFIAGEKSLSLIDLSEAKEANNQLDIINGSLSDLRINNAFTINKGDSLFICTTATATIKIKGDKVIVNKNIAFLNPKPIYSIKEAYKISSTDVVNNDSIFIKGYTTLDDGEPRNILLRTVADLKKDVNGFFLIIRVAKNLNLASLTGAPILNQEGEVIGVFGGPILADMKDNNFLYTVGYLL